MKKKILIISPYLPSFDEGGRMRLFYSIKYLSEFLDVHLISLIYSEDEKKNIDIIKNFCKEIYLIHKKHIDRKRDLFSKLYRLFFLPPDLITKRFCKEMKAKVDELVKINNYDLIQCLHQYTFQYVPENINIPIILDEHNIESEIFKRAFQYTQQENVLHISKYKFRNKLELLKLRRYEENTWSKVNYIITVSEIDKNILLSRYKHPDITVIPNGVDTEYFKPYETEEKEEIVFTGTFSHQPNLDAFLYFVREIFPIVKKEIKEIKFIAAGKNLPDNIKKQFENRDDIIITGYVQDIRPFIAQARLFVVPIRIGSGTRLKILQAMAMKKCVISTAIGCEGIEVENNKNIIIRNTPEEFANAIIEYYSNQNKLKQIAASGYYLVKEKYEWKNIFRKQIELYRKILNV